MTACLLLLCEDKCYARIGETLEQCEKRYGKRITDREKIGLYKAFVIGAFELDSKIEKDGGAKINGETYYFFRLDRYGICVKLLEDKVDVIRFIKFGEWDLPVKLSKLEMDAFIHANKNVEECVNYVNGLRGKNYVNGADGDMADGYILVITTKEYNNKIEKQKELLKKEQDDKAKNVLKKF